MNIKGLLDQLLGSGSEIFQNDSKNRNFQNPISSVISDKGGAALAGGALGLLLGSKSGRKMGGKVLTYGGLAVLGTLAYKAFQNYKTQSGHTHIPPNSLNHVAMGELEGRSKAVLIAIIAAAKADGHIDEKERGLIDAEVSKLTSDPSLQRWFESELNKPLDPAYVAKFAATPEMAAEIYLASLLAVDQQSFMEKSYIEELGRQLNLPPAFQAELAGQVAGAKSENNI